MTEEQKEKARQRTRKYYVENKEKISKYRQKYYGENKEKISKYQQKYQQKYYGENKEKISKYLQKYLQKYYDENRGKINARNAKRRAQKRNATPTWFEQERDKVSLIYKKARELGFQVDHIVPLHSKKVCGLHTWANLQLLAPEVNISKGNRRWPDMP